MVFGHFARCVDVIQYGTHKKERLKQFQEIQRNVRRLKSEKESFEQKAAQSQQAAVTLVQEVVRRVQEAKTLVQEIALAQELRKLVEEATAQAQEAETLANIVEAQVQKAMEQAAYFEGKVVYFSNKDEATAIADLKNEYKISVRSRSLVLLDPGTDRVNLRKFARSLDIIE